MKKLTKWIVSQDGNCLYNLANVSKIEIKYDKDLYQCSIKIDDDKAAEYNSYSDASDIFKKIVKWLDDEDSTKYVLPSNINYF